MYGYVFRSRKSRYFGYFDLIGSPELLLNMFNENEIPQLY